MKVHAGNPGRWAAEHIFEWLKVKISCTSIPTLGKWQRIKPRIMAKNMMANLSSARRRTSFGGLEVSSGFLAESDLQKIQ